MADTTDSDIFDINAQAEFLQGFGNRLAGDARAFAMDGSGTALHPLSALDDLVVALRSQGVDEAYVTAVESLKNDADIQAAVELFQRALEGKANIHALADMVPQGESSGGGSFVAFRDDPGMNGAVLTGTISETGESDLIRFSSYLSGAGTTVGGALVALPGTVVGLANSINNMTLFRYQRLKDKLDELTGDLNKVIEQNRQFYRESGIDLEDVYRRRRGYTIDLSGQVNDAARSQIKVSYESTQTKLLHQTFLTNVDLQNQRASRSGALRAQGMLGKIGTGVQGVTGAFSVGMGGVDIAAGDQMLQNAERQLRAGEITPAQYDTMRRDAQLRIAQGAFGIGDGINNIRAIVMDKLADQVKNLSRGATMGLRFASVVGGAFSIGMGITSVTKNAIAADDARRSGNIGKAAVYGIMAGLDCVSIVLDSVSMVLDFIPGIGQALSFVVDLVNTIVSVVNMIIGFFADMIDTRTPEEKLRGALEDHIDSAAFQRYLDNQAAMYKEQGYDLFQYIVDAKALGLEEDGVDGTTVDKEIVRKLTDKAVADGKDPNLRLALVDASSIGRELHGRLGDDLIRAGAGNDSVHGEAGDDLLFGEAADDTLYGGPGKDYLNGGTGRDVLLGGTGDDWLVMEPGIDVRVEGGDGADTLEISSEFFALGTGGNDKAIVLGLDGINRVYVDLSRQAAAEKGRGGLALGALLHGLAPLANPMHKPAFAAGSTHETKLVSTLFWRSGETKIADDSLKGTYLWYLARKDGLHYLTDGRYLYAHGTRSGVQGTWKATYDIQSIPSSVAVYDEANAVMAYTGDSELEAILVFAFKSTTQITGIEKVCESTGSSPNVYTDINAQVIGDDSVDLIDIRFGHNEYVYTGNGDTVVSMAASASPELEIWKYIVGGDGDNTLIINSSRWSHVPRSNGYSAKNTFMLLDHDVDLRQANRWPNEVNVYAWSVNGDEVKVDRGIFLENMQTIQLTSRAEDDITFHLDATNLREGHRFIVDSGKTYFRLVGSAGDDAIQLKRITGTDNQIDGYLGRNMLSLEFLEDFRSIQVDIDVPPGYVCGSVKATGLDIGLKNIHAVRGNPRVTSLKGHSSQDNLLVASGGQCTVEGRGGNNTLVAMRGRHTLIGGEGQDGYELHGPTLTETSVISVSKDASNSLEARTQGGIWNGYQLTIPLLADDHVDLRLSAARLVDADGNTLTGKGTLSLSSDKRQMVYDPGSAFDGLEKHASETIRVQYTTTGSYATIHEAGIGNRLKLKGYASKSQLKLVLAQSGDLEWRDAGSNALVFTDTGWGQLFRAGVTDLEALFADFAARFAVIELNDTDEANNRLEKGEVADFLYEQLGHHITASNVFDNKLDTASMSGNVIDAGGGDNVVLVKRKNVTYVGGTGDDIFDARAIGSTNAGTQPATLIKTGVGQDLVAIGDSADTVRVQLIADGASGKQGFKTLVVKDIDLNQLGVSQSGSELILTHAGKTPAILDVAPDLIFFEREPWGALIDDVPAYLAARKQGSDYNYRRAYNAKREQQLRLTDLTASQVTLHISVMSYGLDIRLMHGTTLLHGFQSSVATSAVLDAVTVAHAVQLELMGGIAFQDQTLDPPHVRAFVMDKLRTSEGHTVVGATNFEHVADMSKLPSPCTLPMGDALVFANKEGAVVQAGEGNNVIKITASRVTAGTGRPRDEHDGHDIVQVEADLDNVTVNFIAPDDSYSIGAKYVIMDGIQAESVTFTRPDGNPLGNYYEPSQPCVLKVGDRVVARFDCAPTHFLFRHGDEYELIESAGFYIRQHARGQWIQRYFINRDSLVAVKAEDIDAGELTLKVDSRYSATSVLFHSPSVYNVAQIFFDTKWAGITSGELAVKLAARMPGGIRFRDRSYVGDALITFLRDRLLSAEKHDIVITDGAPPRTVDEERAIVDPYKKYLAALAKTQQAITITRIDAEGVLIGLVPVDGPSITTQTALSQYEWPSGLWLIPNSICPVLQWNGYTYWSFIYDDNRNAMAIIAMDASKNVVQRWDKWGARYLNRITKDSSARTVTFIGQGDYAITMSWDELSIP